MAGTLIARLVGTAVYGASSSEVLALVFSN